MNNNFSYKVGGSLPEDAPSYVVRQADIDLYNELKVGNFCYIFNSRQMGKTSLQVRTIKRLQAEGIACTTIDISGRGSKDINPEQWYAGIVYTLVANFQIANPSEFIRTWWKQNSELSPIQRLDIFIEAILLEKIRCNIVIFIDEIDSILSLTFQGDDFFSWIRSCYEKRNYNSDFNRITFVLLGVVTPSDLIADKIRTPFNIGCAIQLNGFQIQEIPPLAEGLKGIENPQAVLQEVLAWTGGQPFLTQKLCDLLVNSQQYNEEVITKAEFVKNIVIQQIIENWESQDEPPHLKTIKDRILMSKHNTGALLGLYQKILQLGQIPASDSPEQIELRLSGLVVESSGYLKVYNRIYATVFDLNWVEKALMNLRPYSEALLAWFASNCQDNSRLLQGLALQEAQNWAANKSLTEQDYQFLSASQELEKQEIAKALSLQEEESRILAQANDTLTTAQHQAKRQIRIGSGVLIASLLGAIIASVAANISTNQLREAQAGTQLEKIGANALQEFKSRQIESLVSAIDGGQKLREIVKDGRSLDKYPAINPVFALRTIVDKIREINQFTAHKEPITSANWSHDGQYIVTSSIDGTAKIWNTLGKEVTELKTSRINPTKGSKGELFAANFSQDGKHIVAMSDDNTARIWDRSGKEVAILKHQEWVTSASFNPDGKTIITTTQKIEDTTSSTNPYGGNIARIWDLSGNLLRELKHESRVIQASFSPNGKYILTVNDKNAQIWNTSGKVLKTFTADNTEVRSAYWSPDSQYILTNSNNSYLWDISGNKIKTFSLGNEIFSTVNANFSPDGKRIVISNLTTTRILDISGKQIAEVAGRQFVNDAGFSPNSKLFFTQDDENVRVWDNSDNIFPNNFLTELVGNQSNLRWSPDGRYIVTFGFDRKVRIWDLSPRVPPVRINSPEAIQQASTSPDGKYIATPTSKSAIIWDTNGKQLTRITGHSDRVNSANFSSDGKRIITASSDKTVRVWDTSGKQLLLLAGHEAGVELAGFSPDGKYILTTTYEPSQTSRIWSQSGQLLATLKGKGMAWSRNSRYIIAKFNYDGKNNSSLWDISGKNIVQFDKSENTYLNASFSFDGERIVTTDRNKINIWNTSGQKLSEFKVDRDIANASFSPDGKLILATSADNRAIIWDVNGKQLVEISHADSLGYAKFSPDGKLIVTESRSANANVSPSTFRIWDISGKQLGEYKYLPSFIQEVSFSPNGKYIYAHTQGNRPSLNSVLIWPIDDLDGLLMRGCDRLKDYLNIHPQVRERLKVCQAK